MVVVEVPGDATPPPRKPPRKPGKPTAAKKVGPALAAAHVGITLGMASDVALEVADVVLVTNDLTRLPYAIRLARKATGVVAQNLVFAAAVILTGIPLALFGFVSLPIGVVMHEGSTLIVVANGLRLLRRLPKVAQ